MSHTTPLQADARPVVVMLCNAKTPYRIAFHVRVARELPAFRLMSVFTHETSNSPWSMTLPPEIGPVTFGYGEPAGDAPRKPITEWKKAGQIIDLFKKERPIAVVLHGYNDAGRWRILRWCHRQGIPVFLWGDSNIRGDRATGLKRAVKAVFLRSVINQVSTLLACGSLGRDFFLAYGAKPESILYMPCEPDYTLIQALPAQVIIDTAAKFRLNPARRRIIYSGRLAPEKRVDLLLQAWFAIAAQRPDWDLLLVGDGPLRAELEASVPADLASRTTFAGFQAEQETVSALYRNADLLCLPSSYEPWALVINEAAAAGLAIVASDVVGAAAELVKNDVNGKLFKTNDLSDLKSALLQVTNPANIDRLREGSAVVLSDWRQQADPVAGLQKALARSGIS